MKKMHPTYLTMLSVLLPVLFLTACEQAATDSGMDTEFQEEAGSSADFQAETDTGASLPSEASSGFQTNTDTFPSATETNTESQDGLLVEFANQSVYMSLVLPSGWEYSTTAYTDEYSGCGIRFWPEGVEEGKISLFYYDTFGVCGTGLTSKEITFSNGLTASMGTYDGHDWWDFILFQTETEGRYVALTENAAGWWTDYEKEVMQILDSVRFEADEAPAPGTAEVTIID